MSEMNNFYLVITRKGKYLMSERIASREETKKSGYEIEEIRK